MKLNTATNNSNLCKDYCRNASLRRRVVAARPTCAAAPAPLGVYTEASRGQRGNGVTHQSTERMGTSGMKFKRGFCGCGTWHGWESQVTRMLYLYGRAFALLSFSIILKIYRFVIGYCSATSVERQRERAMSVALRHKTDKSHVSAVSPAPF